MKVKDLKFFFLLFLLFATGCRDVEPLPDTNTPTEQFIIDKARIDSLITEKGWEGVDTTASGVRYVILDSGAGKELELNDIIRYDFILSLVDGEILATSVDSVAEADTLTVFSRRLYTYTTDGWAINNILTNPTNNSYANHERGFKEGLAKASEFLHVGGRAVILVPSYGAYGSSQGSLDSYAFLRNEPIVYEIYITNAE